MKSKTSKPEIATHQAKGKVKLKTLKLHKETVENLSDREAADVKGGAKTQIGGTCGCPVYG
jgi:natural product precursor